MHCTACNNAQIKKKIENVFVIIIIIIIIIIINFNIIINDAQVTVDYSHLPDILLLCGCIVGAIRPYLLIILHMHSQTLKDVNVGKVVTDLAIVKDRRLSRTLPVKNLITIL